MQVSRTRPVGLIVVAAAIAAAVTGVALADAGSPPSAGYVSIPAHNILSNTIIGAGGINSPVAIGGSTTVPTNATAVRMTVTVKDTKSGSLQLYPAGDPTALGATAVSFTGGTTATATVNETVGASSKISLHNTSAASATVTVTLIGYSTQISASSIAPDGGTSGQVLTDGGGNVSWQTPTIMTRAYENTNTSSTVLLSPGASLVTVASVSVPAGSYVLTFTGTTGNGSDSSFDTTQCRVNDGAAIVSGGNDTALPQSSISDQILVSTATPQTFTVKCEDGSGHEKVQYPTLIAAQVGAVG